MKTLNRLGFGALSAAFFFVNHSSMAGDIDPTSNAGGAGANGRRQAVAVQLDGTIAPNYFTRLLAAPGALAFSSATYDVTEGNNATIAVKRTGGTDNQVAGKVTLTDVTTSPEDYLFTPGASDVAFNAAGAGANLFLFAVAVQADGKILMGGNFTTYNGEAASINVMRLNADGTRDATFNAGGAGADSAVRAMAVQADGKIIIGGQFTSYNGDATASDFVMRLNADGTRDTTFNAGGGAGADSFVYAVAVQPDGKIVIGGLFASYNGDGAASDKIMRLNADGTRDTTFNTGGAGADSHVFAIAVQPDGKIVIGGQFTSYNGDGAASDRIMRLNADGTRDMTFNTGGTGANIGVAAVALQPDGKTVIGGNFTSYNGDAAASDRVMRLNADGTLDTTFNAGGAGANSIVVAVALQPDGKIVIGGEFTSYNGDATASDFVMRLNADGTLDPAFNAGGVGADSFVYSVAVQPDGKIVIGGFFDSYNGDTAANDRVMRLDGDLFLTWPAGDAADKIIQLPIINDGAPEGDETLTLTLTVMSGNATLGSPESSTLTIHDPGAPPTPTPTPGLVVNVSTRLPVGTDDNVLIEGFIVQGPVGSTKKIMVRAIGPSLVPFGIPDAVANPTLEIRDPGGAMLAMNNDWKSTQVGGLITGDQFAEISGSGLAPSNDLESAIIANLTPGSYTAIVRGLNNTVGTGVVDAYDLSTASPAKLANVATRGLIQPGDKLMIAGFIIQNGPVRAVVRAIGPSLVAFGITNALPDTTLQLRDQNGAIVRENDDWKTTQQTELEGTGLQPTNDLEAALVHTLQPGQYTALVRGKPEATGIGVVEVYFPD